MVETALGPERLTAQGDKKVVRAADPARLATSGATWVYAGLIIQLACQLALLVGELAPARVFIRSAAFGTSLVFLVLAPRQARGFNVVHALALVAFTIITLEVFNPLGGAPLAVIAHWMFHLAILAPLFWIGRLNIPRGTVARVLLVLWAFHTIGSLLGVLQVYFPGRFQPDLSAVADRPDLMIRLSSGEWVPRPMGLTDTPGGAGAEGLLVAASQTR